MYNSNEDLDWIRVLCEKNFSKVVKNCPYVDLSSEECFKISKLAENASLSAKEEKVQKKDNENFEGRFFAGYVGEYAVNKYFGYIGKFKASYAGGSYSNTIADLSHLNLNVGIKTSRVGRSIKVNRDCNETQLICQYKEYTQMTSEGENSFIRVYLVGFLRPEYISIYCKRDYVDNPKLRYSKIAFVDFDKLLPFNEESLKKYMYNVKIENLSDRFGSKDSYSRINRTCLYMEKKYGYNMEIMGVPCIKNSPYRYRRFHNTFNKGVDSIEFQEEILSALSSDIVIGYGIGGYLHKLQANYKGNKEFKIKYVDLHDLFYNGNPNFAAKMSALWVNDLYVWSDYLEDNYYVEVNEKERKTFRRFRLCKEFLRKYSEWYSLKLKEGN